MMRDELFAYIEKKYKAKPEYLWERYPNYAAFRHRDNRKWFALVMDVPASKLGLAREETVDILNVKLSDPLLADLLIRQEGFYRGYHFSRGSWISILLDGTVPLEELARWLDESFRTTASRKTAQKLRPPKAWLVPANPAYYDVQAAFERAEEIDWKQGRGVKTGDTVFLYVGAPVSAILYKCRVTRAQIPCRFDDGRVHMDALMRLRLQKRYDPSLFPLEVLRDRYGVFSVRGPRGVPPELITALK